MPDEKVKENPTKKLQELIKKRETPLIISKQNEYKNNRRNSSGGFSGDGYSSFDED
jgi:hypothetical protein